MRVKVFLSLILVFSGLVYSAVMVVRESMKDNIIYALTNDFFVYEDLKTSLSPSDLDSFSIVSYSSLNDDEKDFLKSQYYSYGYLLVEEGLYDVVNKALCEDDKVYPARFWNCSGVQKDKQDMYKVLLFKISVEEPPSSPYESVFCGKRCYDARADVNEISWKSTEGNKTYTLTMKKGFYLNIFFRPYGNGCFVDSPKLKVCISGSSLTFEFVHSDGTRYSLSSPVLMKYFNTATLGVSPNMITLFVRQHGKQKTDFKYIDLDYKPLDEDDPAKSYSFSVSLKPLNNDPYEYFQLSFKQGQTKLPFCGEQIASCSYDYGAFHVWEENGTYMFGGTVASAIKVDPDSMVYYYRNAGFEARENTGDMALNGKGAKRQWKDTSSNQWGFTQEETKSGITEEWGFIFDTSTLTPIKIGFFREKSDMLPFFYGFESDRKTGFLDYIPPYPAFYSDTGKTVPDIVSCPSGSTEISGYCYFPPKATTCPSGYTFNIFKLRCEKKVTCPEGGTMSGTRCEKPPSYSCPSGLSFDSSAKVCYSTPSCPTGFTFNPSTDRCEKSISSCPAGFTRTTDGRCVTAPSCPSGFTFNPVSGQCEAPASSTTSCPTGYTYDSKLKTCVVAPRKVSRTTSSVRCESNRYAYQECKFTGIDIVAQIDLARQRSRTTCRSSNSSGSCQNWTDNELSPPLKCDGGVRDVRFGITPGRGSMWVDDGCRGDFEAYGCTSGQFYDPLFTALYCLECDSSGKYNPSTQMCELPPTVSYSCPTGTLVGTVCVVPPSCPPDTTYAGGVCELDMSLYCSPGSYIASSGLCVANYSCPSGSTYNSYSNRCETSPTVDCGSYSYSAGMCYLSISSLCASTDNYEYQDICWNTNYTLDCGIPGSVFDPSTKQCKLKAGSHLKLTDDGVFEKKYSLCPSGQVELFSGIGKDYEGKCFEYLYDAYCVDETVSGKDQDQFGKYCYLQEPVTPSVCPLDGRVYTVLSPPSYSNYYCETTKSPYCTTGERDGAFCYDTVAPDCPFDGYTVGIRTGGTCLYQITPDCPSGCTYVGSGTCFCGAFGGSQPATCPAGYTLGSIHCEKTTSVVCPAGYSYNSSLDACGKSIGSACNNDTYNDWSYSSSLDMCYHRELATCPASYFTFTDPDTGYTACYTKNLSTPSSPRGSDTEKGRVYCEAGHYYWKDRCYQYKQIACDGKYDYTHTKMIVIGKGNSLDEWTGECWEKVQEGCSGGTYPGRGEYTTEKHCLKPEKTFSSIYKGTKTDFVQNMCESIAKAKFSSVGSCKVQTSYKSVDAYYIDPTPSICPLSSGGICLPVSGELSICGISKSCAACMEGEPPKVISNPAYSSIKQIEEKSGKAYGLTWSDYDKLGVERLLDSIPSARLPKSGETSLIDSIFPEISGNYWIDTELAGDYFEYSSISLSSYGSYVLPKDVVSVLRIKNVKGSFSACSSSDCSANDSDVVKSFFAFKDDSGNWYWLGNPDSINIPFDTSSLKVLKFSYDIGTDTFDITVPVGVKIVQIADIGYALGLSSADYTGSVSFSYGMLKVKPLVLVFDNPSDAGFFAECVFTDDYNMLCTADMVECTSGTCPYGPSYPCFQYKGKEYCSKYSDQCISMADPANQRQNLDTEEGLNDKKPDGTIDSSGKCLGTVYIFNGYDRRCRPPGVQTLGNNCCEDESIDLTGEIELSKCSDSERFLVNALKPEEGTKGKCHYVGEYCAEKWLGVCVQKKKTYCCFGSVMARITHEQGRPQLGDAFGPDCATDPSKCWGDPKSPICRGFTPEEFQNIDFAKIDFSEFETALGNKVSSIDAGKLVTEFSTDISDSFDHPDIEASSSTFKVFSYGGVYLDFGNVPVGNESSVQSFVVKNVGSKDLNITKVVLLGGEKYDYIIVSNTCGSSIVLSPGSSCEIKVKFRPRATGRRGAYIRFESNDPDEQRFDIHLVGFGI